MKIKQLYVVPSMMSENIYYINIARESSIVLLVRADLDDYDVDPRRKQIN